MSAMINFEFQLLSQQTCNYASVAIIIRVKPDQTDHIFNSPLFKASVASPDADSLESLLDFVSCKFPVASFAR